MAGDLDNWFSSTAEIPDRLRGCVVAIGNFDGVHLGHRAVLQAACRIAEDLGAPSLALTFEPHPRTFFRPDLPVFRLTDPRRKAELMLECGMDAVVSQSFDTDFASQDGVAFIGRHLVKDLGATHVVTGFNFHFGKGRSGSPELLESEGSRCGFGVTPVNGVRDPENAEEYVSSSGIRKALEEGDVCCANRLLGRAWDVSGTVVKGAQLGRTLGYPTANLRLPDETRLRHGIYAVRAHLDDGTVKDGVASFGRRPTFDNGAPLLETFVFDYSGDLYGRQLGIVFHGWIRPERKFDSVEALVAQMDLDSAEAKRILKARS